MAPQQQGVQPWAGRSNSSTGDPLWSCNGRGGQGKFQAVLSVAQQLSNARIALWVTCWGSFQHWSCTQAVNVPNALVSKAHRTHSQAFFGRREKNPQGQQGKQLLLEALPQPETMCHQHGSSLVRHSFLSSCEGRNCNPCSTWSALSDCSNPSHSSHHHGHLQI